MIAYSQSGGRFEEAKRQALGYLASNQYDRAAARLEDVWEQDKADATVPENLALAYMNGGDRQDHPEVVDKAKVLMEQAIHMGGKASFLVQHSHEKLKILQGKTIADYCSGTLSISPHRLVFVAQARKGEEAHPFDMATNQVRASADGDAFQLKTPGKTYRMIPRTRIKGDSVLILSLIQKNLDVQ